MSNVTATGWGLIGIVLTSPVVVCASAAQQENPRVHRKGTTITLGQDATDADLERLKNEKGITSLRMGGMLSGAAGPFITDAGLAHISGWSDLKTLVIWGMPTPHHARTADIGVITDDGLKHIAGLTKLEPKG